MQKYGGSPFSCNDTLNQGDDLQKCTSLVPAAAKADERSGCRGNFARKKKRHGSTTTGNWNWPARRVLQPLRSACKQSVIIKDLLKRPNLAVD